MNNPYYNLYKANSLSHSMRKNLVSRFAWAVPDDTAIKMICEYSPIIEIGAGTGYWASLISEQGAKIICFDKFLSDNTYGHKKQYIPINSGDHTVLEKFSPKMTLFLCWPPCDEDMAYDCIKAFKGKYFIYIGEGPYGCTGDDKFHEELENNWNWLNSHDIPQWSGLHDELNIYKRKS